MTAAVNWGSVPGGIAALLAITGLPYETRKRRIAEAEATAERRAVETNQIRLVSVDVRVRSDANRARLTMRNDSEAPTPTVSPVLCWAESGALWRIPQLAVGSLLTVLALNQSVTSLAEDAANEPGPPGSAAVRGAVAEGRPRLSIADAASPVPVLNGDHDTLQSAVDRS